MSTSLVLRANYNDFHRVSANYYIEMISFSLPLPSPYNYWLCAKLKEVFKPFAKLNFMLPPP